MNEEPKAARESSEASWKSLEECLAAVEREAKIMAARIRGNVILEVLKQARDPDERRVMEEGKSRMLRPSGGEAIRQPKCSALTPATQPPPFAADHALSATERAGSIFSRSFLERVFHLRPLASLGVSPPEGTRGAREVGEKTGAPFQCKESRYLIGL